MIAITVLVLLIYSCSQLPNVNARLYLAEQCRQELETGRLLLQQAKQKIVTQEYEQQGKRMLDLIKQNLMKQSPPNLSTPDPSFCPVEPRTTTLPLAPKNIAPITRANAEALMNDYVNNSMDLLNTLISGMRDYLSDAKKVCEGSSFPDGTPNMDHQIFALLPLLAVNRDLPLCFICDNMLTEAEHLLFAPSSKELSPSDEVLRNFLLAHVPSVKAVCSSLVPTCHIDYEMNAIGKPAFWKCTECAVCMIATKYIASRTWNRTALNQTYTWIKNRILKPVCLRACRIFRPNSIWDGISYNRCMKFSTGLLDQVIVRIKSNMRPDEFCYQTLKLCDYKNTKFGTCLKEICKEFLPIGTRMICSLIPDNLIYTDGLADLR